MYKGYEGDCVEIIPTIEEIPQLIICDGPVSYTHLRAHET